MSRKLSAKGEDYYCGTRGVIPLRWTAPEALKTSHFSAASDVWSFGVLCGEILDDGAKVWHGEASRIKVLERISF